MTNRFVPMIAAIFVALTVSPLRAQRDLKVIPPPDPELERETFVLPEGFEVNLFAADPQIAKPIQINFDPQGRLWIASSQTYPQILPGEKADDKILILEDKDGDGVSDETTVFADGLLIPTGVEPGDGGAYVGASTELLHFTDTDGDGRADRKEIIFSGFGTEDTHHILHTLRWGPEGLLYMSQSIYIHSHIETPWGVRRLNAGGIWQFRPETLELDVYARGLVNTWGTAFDAFGVTFATDGAGGEGINYMVPGAYYTTAFGAPRILQGLNPGSPKHCGLEIVDGETLPDEWQGSFLTNDFRGHRVCRFVVKESGSGFVSQEQQELIKSDHVAFRPVDVKMGPDGAIYIADWYNPIIQHGEVDFRDPRRDHTHGRIWRITYKGQTIEKPRFSAMGPSELVKQLASVNEWTRQQVKRVIKERAGAGEKEEILAALKQWARSQDNTAEGYHRRRLEVLWTYQALNVVEPELLDTLLRCGNAGARAAATRVIGHWMDRLSDPLEMLADRVQDEHPRVRLEAVRVLALSTKPQAAEVAMQALDFEIDEWLEYALWQTARELQDVWQPALLAKKIDFDGNVRHLTFALKSAGSQEAVPVLLSFLQQGKVQEADRRDVLETIAQFGSSSHLDALLALTHDAGPEQVVAILTTLRNAALQRKVRPEQNLSVMESFLAAENPPVRAAALLCAGVWNLEQHRPQTIQLAGDRSASDEVRLAAMQALADFGGEDAVKALEGLANSGEPNHLRRGAILALLSLRPKAAANVAVGWLSALPEPDESQPLFAAFLARKQGPALLEEALKKATLPTDVAIVGLRTVQSSGQPHEELAKVLRAAGQVSSEPVKLSPEEVNAFAKAVSSSGDPARGELVYRRSSLSCLKCHSIGPAGGQVGPNMLSLGATAQLDYIAESLLDPAAKVKEGYHTAVIATTDGQVYSGIQVRQTDRELILRDAEDREFSVPLSAIEDQKVGNSLMPAGLTASLTRQELYDLTAFLAALGKLPEYTITPGLRVRHWEVMLPTNEASFRLRRTSYASAATDDPAFRWNRVYSTVQGELPLGDLPEVRVRNRVAAGERGMSFARFSFESSGEGSARVVLGDPTGLQVWLDHEPIEPAEKVDLKLSPGRHRMTFAVDRSVRSAPLSVEFEEPAEGVIVRLPTGK